MQNVFAYIMRTILLALIAALAKIVVEYFDQYPSTHAKKTWRD